MINNNNNNNNNVESIANVTNMIIFHTARIHLERLTNSSNWSQRKQEKLEGYSLERKRPPNAVHPSKRGLENKILTTALCLAMAEIPLKIP